MAIVEVAILLIGGVPGVSGFGFKTAFDQGDSCVKLLDFQGRGGELFDGVFLDGAQGWEIFAEFRVNRGHTRKIVGLQSSSLGGSWLV